MNLYLISQTVRTGYDTYDSAVVAADTPEQAANIHPSGSDISTDDSYTWVDTPNNVDVKLIGVAVNGIDVGVICASFNAG